MAITDGSKLKLANVKENNQDKMKREVGLKQMKTLQIWKLIIKIFPKCVVHNIITSKSDRLLKKKTRHFRDHIKYLKNFKIPYSISTVKVQLR